MILVENFTIKQTKLINSLFNDGYTIKKYDGLNFITLIKGCSEVTINN